MTGFLKKIKNKIPIFKKKKKFFKILSIDGGGIKGIFPVTILNKIKENFDTVFFKDFDLIAGTSTGAIIAAALAVDYSVEDIANLYETKGKQVFEKNDLSLKSIYKSRYKTSSLKSLLREKLGDMKMSDVKCKIMIPATDITNGKGFVFTQKNNAISLVDAVLASTAAPLYFNPIKIHESLFVDGGVWANNPSLIALMEVVGKLNIPVENIKLVSLGTGDSQKTGFFDIKDEEDANWGLIKWNEKIIDLLLSVPTRSIHKIVEGILDDEHYLRLDFKSEKEILLDDLSKVSTLKEYAVNEFESKRDLITRMLDI
ncbi:patatin [Candidatus Dojkabacteria bacterium]|nr:patatin [Candidatus Dojkabacteria bacterium]